MESHLDLADCDIRYAARLLNHVNKWIQEMYELDEILDDTNEQIEENGGHYEVMVYYDV